MFGIYQYILLYLLCVFAFVVSCIIPLLLFFTGAPGQLSRVWEVMNPFQTVRFMCSTISSLSGSSLTLIFLFVFLFVGFGIIILTWSAVASVKNNWTAAKVVHCLYYFTTIINMNTISICISVGVIWYCNSHLVSCRECGKWLTHSKAVWFICITISSSSRSSRTLIFLCVFLFGRRVTRP